MATAAPLWTGPYLPITDLPQHVAAIAALRHWWDPAWKVQEYYTLAMGQASYVPYYVVGAVLAVPCGSAERANLLLLSPVAVAFPYSSCRPCCCASCCWSPPARPLRAIPC